MVKSRIRERMSTPATVADGPPAVAFEDVSKRFGAHWANRNITLDIFGGEVHALVGENGAGKSTLMHILYGHLKPDTGRILLHGQPAAFREPAEAIRARIGMVHQQLLIFPQLTALENIIAGWEPNRWGWLRRRAAKEKTLALCRLFGFDLPLDTPAGEVSFARRQQIELLRVLYRGARVLILDEPTSLLAPPEVERLLELLRDLKREGFTVVFISHRLREVFAVADRISVLRHGRLLSTCAAPQTSVEKVAREIMGLDPMGLDPVGLDAAGGALEPPVRGAPAPDVPGEGPLREPLLVLDGVDAIPTGHEAALQEFSLEIRRGEILGIGGVVGNGQRALAQVTTGFLAAEKGRILFGDRDISRLPMEERVQRGIRWLPANTVEEALLPDRPLWENILLGHQRERSFQCRGRLVTYAIAHWGEEQLRAHGVVYRSLREPLRALSGGNQQKVALARVLEGAPALVVLEQPSRGLDIHAQERLRGAIRTMNARGVTFLVFSYDLDELLSLCSRIGILYRGRLMGMVQVNEARREELGRWMLGAASGDAPGARNTDGFR